MELDLKKNRNSLNTKFIQYAVRIFKLKPLHIILLRFPNVGFFVFCVRRSSITLDRAENSIVGCTVHLYVSF